MRAVHLTDLNIAARTLLALAPDQRAGAIARLLICAHIADKYRKKTGRAHALYGNGTLGAACQSHPKRRMPDRCDPAYLECFRIVIHALLDRTKHENA